MQGVRERKTFRALCFLITYYVPTQCWEPCPQALSHSTGHHPYFTEEGARARRDLVAAQGHTSSKDEMGHQPDQPSSSPGSFHPTSTLPPRLLPFHPTVSPTDLTGLVTLPSLCCTMNSCSTPSFSCVSLLIPHLVYNLPEDRSHISFMSESSLG